MKNLDLRAQVFISFWGPAILAILIATYYPLKRLHFPIKKEIHIPEEHQHFVEALKHYEKMKKSLAQKEFKSFEVVYFGENPFYISKNPKISSLKFNLFKLSSIIKIYRNICIINERPYTEGEYIGNVKIKKIGDYYVELETKEGRVLRLQVGNTFTYTD